MTIKVDIGCGAGKLEDCIGIDIYKTDDVDILASATNLIFKDNSVDYIYTRECIQHIRDSDVKALTEMCRVLKPEGIAEIIVSSFYGWFFWKIGISSRQYRVFRLYTDHLLRRKLNKIGFRNCVLTHVFIPKNYLTSKKLLRHVKLQYHDIKAICQKR